MRAINLFVVVLGFAVNVFAADPLTERLQRGLFEEEANRNLDAAIKEYQSVVTQSDEQRKVIATALFRLGECYRKLGKTNDASAQYQRIVRDFAEQEQLVKLSRDLLGMKAVAALPGAAETATSLTQAEAEELARVKTLARNSPDLLRAPSNGFTELQRAARSGHYSVAEFLISQGVKANDPFPNDSPMIEAAARGHLRIVQLLLDHGATQDDAGDALIIACRDGFKSVAELLMARGADVNWSYPSGESALHYAVVGRHESLVELLLARGAKPDVLANASISYSIPNFNPAVAKGTTPLHEAASRGSLPIAERLIKAGASVQATNYEAMTPLHFAANAGHTNLCALLVARGADVNAPDAQGMTPLTRALWMKQIEVVKFLLQHGANPDHVSGSYQQSALEFALGTGSEEVLSALLAAKPKLDIKFANHLTPVQDSVQRSRDRQAILLLDAGADANGSMTSDGYTPLHFATQNRPELVAALVKHGANPNVITRQGTTPLSMALEKAGRKVVVPGTPAPGPMRAGFGSGNPAPITAEEAANYQRIVELLRAHGADEFLQRRGFISAVRSSEQRVTIFSKGTNDVNRYTLMEFLAAVYENGGFDFPFPDFASITIHRLDGKSEKPIRVNVLALMLTTNCLGDQPLEWGDNVEIPMADHQMGIRWAGFAGPERITLQNCVQRTVRFRAGGTDGTFILSPKVGDGANGFVTRSPFFLLSSTVLRNARFSSLLRTSSDLSRVTVMRLDPQTKETKKMTFDLNAVALPDMSYSSGNQPPIPWAHDLWLRDGDVIEVPEKP